MKNNVSRGLRPILVFSWFMFSYLTFPAIAGKNTVFQNLAQEPSEELGGINLSMLMWLSPWYPAFVLLLPISRSYPLPVLLPIFGDPLFLAGDVHVAAPSGKHLPDTQTTPERTSRLVSCLLSSE